MVLVPICVVQKNVGRAISMSCIDIISFLAISHRRRRDVGVLIHLSTYVQFILVFLGFTMIYQDSITFQFHSKLFYAML